MASPEAGAPAPLEAGPPPVTCLASRVPSIPAPRTDPTVRPAHRSSAPAAPGWRAALRRAPGGALLLKAVVFVVGLAFVVLGCVLIVAPGPLTIPPILLGLYLWSTEFAWADRWLERAKDAGRAAWTDARRRPVLSGVLTGGGLIGLGLALWAAARYELLARALEVVGL